MSVTESAVRSRLIQFGEPMAESSYFLERAEQALRLARDSTDPELINNLTALALEYSARAAAIDGLAPGNAPEEDA